MLQINIQTHMKLQSALHLFKQNHLLGTHAMIPGIVQTTKTGKNIDSLQIMQFQHSSKFVTAFVSCLLEPVINLYINNLKIFDCVHYENNFIEIINEMHSGK